MSIPHGSTPIIKHIPRKVRVKGTYFSFVIDSLNKREAIIITNARAGYNKAIATGILENSMAVNKQ